MEHIQINDIFYYQYETIIAIHPCLKNVKKTRHFIEKYNIPSNKYLYAHLTKKTWIKSNDSNKRNIKFFIKKSWFDKTFVFRPYPINQCESSETQSKFDTLFDDVLIVGERTYNGCFFYFKDISKKFQIHNVITSDDNYIELIDYKYFINPDSGKSQLFLTYTQVYLNYYLHQEKEII